MREIKMKKRTCESCGASIAASAVQCKYCDSNYASKIKPKQQQGNATHKHYHVHYDAPTHEHTHDNPEDKEEYYAKIHSRSNILAGVLAILFGWLGVHKFYLGKNFQGIMYILFSATGIPWIVSIVEGIIYLRATPEEFYYKYVIKY